MISSESKRVPPCSVLSTSIKRIGCVESKVHSPTSVDIALIHSEGGFRFMTNCSANPLARYYRDCVIAPS